MPRTLISLGANLGNVRESMGAAKRLLIDSFGASNLVFSQLYRTPPIGGPGGQGDFLNAVVAIDTDRSVWEVWELIQAIESALGRQRQHRWEARRIDVDLLLFDQQRIWTPHLKIPHPRMCMRTFVIEPALEIVPNSIEPVTGWTISRLHNHLVRSHRNNSMIQVLCQDASQLSQLQREFAKVVGSDNCLTSEAHPLVQWSVANAEQMVGTALRQSKPKDPLSKLTIAAVASPDPMTVLWEDFSKPWVKALNMDTRLALDSNEFRSIEGPRYLMPSDDPKWAVHEILAASQAMQCELEAVETF